MIDLAAVLAEIVNRSTRGPGAAGIAALVAGAADPVAVWTPPARDEPAFLAYSITKTFTAVLFLLLRDEGRLALDDRLVRWFSRIPGADRISLRQPLNHTAGIPNYGGLPSYHDAVRASPSTPWSLEQVAAETFDIARFFDAVFRRRLVPTPSLDEMRMLVPVAGAPPTPSLRWSRPGYGLGIVGIQESPFGPLWGHNGSGPGYRTSAYHAPDLGEASVCAMCALEEEAGADPLVFAVFAALRGQDST